MRASLGLCCSLADYEARSARRDGDPDWPAYLQASGHLIVAQEDRLLRRCDTQFRARIQRSSKRGCRYRGSVTMERDWLGVKDWVAVVTGAGGGMGRAIAEAFASQGACVALLDYNQQSCKSAAQAVTQFGGRAIGIRCDISKPESVQEAGSRVAAELGPCRVLVNNAGVLRPGPLDTLTIDEWNTIIAVNPTSSGATSTGPAGWAATPLGTGRNRTDRPTEPYIVARHILGREMHDVEHLAGHRALGGNAGFHETRQQRRDRIPCAPVPSLVMSGRDRCLR